MAAKAKLTDAQVKEIRRRARAGARITDLAGEYGVNRKTIRRRLDAAELAEAERAEEQRRKRLRRPDRERAPEQATGEAVVVSGPRRGGGERAGSSWSGGCRQRGDSGGRSLSSRHGGASSAYAAWLSTRKNLSAAAAGALQMAADGYVYAVAADGSDRGWYPAGRVPAGHLLRDR